MAVLRDKTIDVSSIKEDDKIIKNIHGSSLSIQVDGNVTVDLRGQHINFASDAYYGIGLVNLSTLEKVATIEGPGLYMAIVEGIDEIKLTVVGSAGFIHWKELGD